MSGNDALEDDLRRSLRRVPAPEGFADRVMARVAAKKRRRGIAVVPAGWWAAAAAVLLMAGGEAVHLHRVQEAQRAEAAAQLTLALTLTNHALAAVEDNVSRSPAGRYTRFLQESTPGLQENTTGRQESTTEKGEQ